MKHNIKVLISTNCELLVSPLTDLTDPGFVYVEFIVSDYNDTLSTLSLNEVPELYRCALTEDGVYMYYRLKIPTLSILQGSDLDSRLYYDDINDKLMIGMDEVTTSKQLNEIVDGDFPETDYGLAEFIEYPVFSICKISLCLENLQRMFIFEGCPEQIKMKCDPNETSKKAIRDFLFSSVFILKTLIRQQRYEEALRILHFVQGCDTICNTRYTNTSCGCKY